MHALGRTTRLSPFFSSFPLSSPFLPPFSPCASSQITLHAASLFGHLRLLLAADPVSRWGVGAHPSASEPRLPWFDIAGYANRYIFENRRESGPTSRATCIGPFLLGAPAHAETQAAGEAGFSLGGEQGAETCHLHFAYRRWTSGRSEFDLGFHNSRLAVYYDRVLQVIGQCVRPFRQPPHERYWMGPGRDPAAAHLAELQYVELTREEVARKGRLPPICPPPEALRAERAMSGGAELDDSLR